ncbi:MAG TPA: dihydrolipoyllysine-residue acetyltransferase [Burkholderiaceae bacterium]|nr:dihydrolipoyllysine-residue acetyltransferase [Burkholderiaceae bacterium]
MGNMIEIKIPDIGDFKDVEVIEVLVKPGDVVDKEQSLITVESDKASMEIPSSAAGTVREMKVKLGDKVSEGSAVLLLESGASAAPAPAPAAAAPPPPVATPPASAPPAPPAAGAPAASLVVNVPDIGDFKDVEVIEVLVKAGDRVGQEQSLITVESDKASMEIPSPSEGVVEALQVKIGDKVSEGTPILTLRASSVGAAASSASRASELERAPAPAPRESAPAPAASPGSSDFAVEMGARPAVGPTGAAAALKPHASPSVRRFARELGVDLAGVRGSGPKGRITQDDVRELVKSVLAGGARPAAAPHGAPAGTGLALNLPAWPSVDFAKFGPVERIELSRVRRISGPNLARNWVVIPHVTNNEDADVTELEAFRVQLNSEKNPAKVTLLAFLIKACVATLKKFPDFNSSLDPAGDAIFRKNYYHIGFAADTPNGLVVPVVKDADKKGIFEIAQETAALAAKAREGKLALADIQGGTFSISSLGGIGGTSFTPIINAPEVAILGVCRSVMRPLWDGKAFVPRLILPLSLSWDHRVVDGASAARFNLHLAQLLADFRRVML